MARRADGWWTLRDVRRYIARRPEWAWSPVSGVYGETPRGAAVRLAWELAHRHILGKGVRSLVYETSSISQRDALRLLDATISLVGPDWPIPARMALHNLSAVEAVRAELARQEREKGEERKKGTSEVDESAQGTDPDAAVHGGDGNSGEVDAVAETSSDQPRAGQSDAQQREEGAECDSSSMGRPAALSADDAAPEDSEEPGQPGTDGAPEGDYAEPHAPTGAAGKQVSDQGTGKETAEADESADDAAANPGEPADTDWVGITGGPGGADETPDDSDNPEREAPEQAGESDQDSWDLEEITDALEGGEDACSLTPRTQFGGVYAELVDPAEARKSLSKDRAAREVARALERLFKSWGTGGIDESPRLDGRRLVREIVSCRYSLSRTHRRELTTGIILVMCDVSGSCSAVAEPTLRACEAVSQRLDNVVLVVHSNGYPQDIWAKGIHVELDASESWRAGEAWWEREILPRTVVGAVAFGDWDAGWIYRIICERGVPFVWLDSFAACDGPKPVPKRGTLRDGFDWAAEPLAWWQGVNSSETAAMALRAAIRAQKERR